MCGVLFLHGPAASRRMGTALERLGHRGPDDMSIWSQSETAIGFCRLAINDKGPHGRQPFVHGPFVGAFNAEIYNAKELIERHRLRIDGHCDTSVILPLYAAIGDRLLDELDGFYSGIIFDPRTGELVCIRDAMGKKPLLLGRSGGEVFLSSELKALDAADRFQMVPKGLSRVRLDNGIVATSREHQPPETIGCGLEQLLLEAVAKRLPAPDEPVGVFFSGGLDSSIVAALTARSRPGVRLYTLASPDASDDRSARLGAAAIGVASHQIIPLPSPASMRGLLERIVYCSESYNPSIVSNGLCTYLVAQAAAADGVRVVLTGEGADELFCGYHRFDRSDPWQRTRQQLIQDMEHTELRRLDMCSMAHGIEARCPFLDRAVVAYSDTLGYDDLFAATPTSLLNKVTLRSAFAAHLPPDILLGPKTSFDVGSGLRAMVVEHLRAGGRTERQELEDIWRSRFPFEASHPYFHEYPVFDSAINRRGATHR